MIGAGVRDSCVKSEARGDPAGAKTPRRLPDRLRKASAWRGNQRSFTNHKNGRHCSGQCLFNVFLFKTIG
ncbi:hypothetical protein KEH51_14100 [[Brevibacterium] frigoritolerans]|uniref:Uncharacterized protein n=1 Tax=Peribacillus frigoritolerans TaxID=450367 RepID=A0A941FLL3_9BACI|nr:hypothetical protein [Peribacillus frigoritolerans]